jgi:ATP-dependent helicase HrpA
VDYARIDPELSRELFIRHALVEGDWRSDHRFLAANRALLEDVEELEHRARRRGLVVGDDALFDFYDQRVPADVVSGRHFDAWWKKARRTDPDLLTFTREMLLAADVDTADTPDEWTQGGLTLPVAYRFEPGAPDDGVTVEVPLAALNRVRPDGFDWQVPALREELVTALIRSLPKQLRRNFVPAPDVARPCWPGWNRPRAAGRGAGPGAAPDQRAGRADHRRSTGPRCRRTCGPRSG